MHGLVYLDAGADIAAGDPLGEADQFHGVRQIVVARRREGVRGQRQAEGEHEDGQPPQGTCDRRDGTRATWEHEMTTPPSVVEGN